MSIRADSYSSTSEVTAFTRHLLDGQSAFNTFTRPTLTELEKFIDRASGILNVAILGAGLAPSGVRANSTAKLTCDDWVTARSAEYVELTQRGVGFNADEGSRNAGFRNMHKAASQFVGEMRLGWVYGGVNEVIRASDGLQFTGLDAQEERADPDDSALEQPIFSRKQFDDPQSEDE